MQVGTVEVAGDETESTPEQWIFDDYTREAAVLNGRPGASLASDKSATPRLLEARVTEGKIEEFCGYLRGRKKAAVAKCGPTSVVMLPEVPKSGSGIALALFQGSASAEDDGEAATEPASKRARVVGENELRVAAVNVEELLAAAPVFSAEAKRAHTDCMVFQDGAGGAVYYQDARRRYEFRCGRPGMEQLLRLGKRTKRVMALNAAELGELDEETRTRLLDEGKKIYGEKPSLHKGGGGHAVTWSDNEYAHVGLRAQYLRLKSFQRFTETYNAAQRAAAYDATFAAILQRPTLRMASLGGGPAFELDAIREYVCASHPSQSTTFELYSIDLQPAWKPYANALGCSFVAPFDVDKATCESLIAASGRKPLDILVVSYLLIYCTNAHTADLFAELLKRELCLSLLISERTPDQDIVKLLEHRGLTVVPLLPQGYKRADQRQLLVMLPSKARKVRGANVNSVESQLIFPNVPFARGT